MRCIARVLRQPLAAAAAGGSRGGAPLADPLPWNRQQVRACSDGGGAGGRPGAGMSEGAPSLESITPSSPPSSSSPATTHTRATGHASIDEAGFVHVAPEALERTTWEPRRRRILPGKQRRQLEKFVYHAHYRPANYDESEAVDPDGWESAAMEVQWIEEHFTQALPREMSHNDVVQRIQRAVLERTDTHKPLAYIMGDQPFYNCQIFCEPPILVPRPETESWVAWLCTKYLRRQFEGALTVVDVCCGTGCIGVAIARNVDNAYVQALDVDPQAVALSEKNARHAGVLDRHSTMRSDMLSALLDDPQHHHSYDVVVANPPYVHPHQWEHLEPAVRLWESKLAVVGDDGRAGKLQYYMELIRDAPKLLRKERRTTARYCPHIVVEVGDQAQLVASAFETSGSWMEVNMFLDSYKKPRWVTAMLK